MPGGNPDQAAFDHLISESEARRFLYRDVESLVTVGFLSTIIPFGGHSLVLRTLSEKSRTALEKRGGAPWNPTSWMQWAVASAVWMVDGFVVGTDLNAPFHVHKWFVTALPRVHLKVLFSLVLGLQNRMTRASSKLEAYCYEPFSRSLWRTGGGSKTEKNVILDSWSAFHDGEDKREADFGEWFRVQAIVGSMSSKGAKAIKRSLDADKQKEESRRARAIEEMVNFVIQGQEEPKTVMVMIGGRMVPLPRVRGAQTVAELEEEMRRAIEGDPDAHDLQVSAYEDALRAAVVARVERARQKQAQQEGMADLMRQAGIGGATRLVGYSARQLAEIVPNQIQVAGVKRTATASSAHRLFDRYVKNNPGVGVIGPDGKPMAHQAKKEPLQDLVRERKPGLRREAMGSSKVRDPDG